VAEETNRPTIDYSWPEEPTLLGRDISRLDGPAKVTGQAQYTYDLKRPGMLYGAVVRCPYAHARVTKIDTAPAEAMAGVRIVRPVQSVGDEIQWALAEVVYLAADTEAQARDAARAVVVEYEVLPHHVDGGERDGTPRGSDPQESAEGDADAAFEAADRIVEGTYAIECISHSCLEAHGQIAEWDEAGEEMTAHCSTQAVSSLTGQFAEALGLQASDVRVICQYMGGGFGSKFGPDAWGIACARLAKSAGRPVKLMLERDAELTVAGDRPSTHARVKIGVREDGTVSGWESESWGSGGLGGAGSPPIPYVFSFPDRRHRHESISTNVAGSRAWRAPNHPQACFVTLAAMEDAAAALGMDPVELLKANLAVTPFADTYRAELDQAAAMIGWRERWRPRGEGGPDSSGPVRRGLGVALHAWGGRGHRSNCEVHIHPDGEIEARLASQDIGTGTRTVIAIVLAETFGLGVDDVTVKIGDSRYPRSGTSGGSTTVGGVSASTRRASMNARAQLFTAVAGQLDADPGDLEAVGGEIRVQGEPSRSLSWARACAAIGVNPLVATGSNPGEGDLDDSGVGGVMMADVAVDRETGVVRVVRMVAAQDCGLIVDVKTSRSQVEGGMIMGISSALAEEKIIDPITGRMLNVDYESYKLAGYADVGTLEVHLMDGPEHRARGPIGVGEPPVIAPAAAVSNAVANALGVRVPHIPLTPRRVLDALDALESSRDGRNA
jgi:xanthine dehydrogenase YagR molybdenum-binding subunit